FPGPWQAGQCGAMFSPSLRKRQFTSWVLKPLSLLIFISIADRAQAQGTAPTITGQPQSLSVSLGANVTFRVTASGSSPLAYQWLHNSVPLVDRTNVALSMTNLS